MATLILRPVSDESLNHSCNSGSSGYSLISESSADDDSTYIYQTVSSTSSASVTSSFTLGGTMPSGLFKITGATLYVRGRSSANYTYSGTYQLSIDSSASSMSLSTSYQTSSSTGVATSLINNTYTSSNFPSLSVTITTAGNKSSSKNSSFQIRVTQIYLELEYEEIIEDPSAYYIKVDGRWRKVLTAYRKVNGAWEEFDYTYDDSLQLKYLGHITSDIIGEVTTDYHIVITDTSVPNDTYYFYYEDANKTKLTDWDVIGSTEFNEYNGGTTTTGEEVGVINEDNSISLTNTSLATGTYTMYYENADGVKLEGWDSIGTVSK